MVSLPFRSIAVSRGPFTGLSSGYGHVLAGLPARSALVWTASARSVSLWLLTGRNDKRRLVRYFESQETRSNHMAWSRPKLREICIGMEINGYFAGKI
jgi:coenzyme PQQ precursor peptide PqqA